MLERKASSAGLGAGMRRVSVSVSLLIFGSRLLGIARWLSCFPRVNERGLRMKALSCLACHVSTHGTLCTARSLCS